MKTPQWIIDIVHLFYPHVCLSCGNALIGQENVLCTACEYHLPKTGFHLYKENPVTDIFWGRVELQAATSFLFYQKGGRVQKLIHQLKYKGKTEVGSFLGKLLGTELHTSLLFKSVELVVPVPLHPKKLKKRGYNQCIYISQGIGKGLNIPVDSVTLKRVENTSTQTKKSREKRWENVKNAFGLSNPEAFENKHVLLVDDVLTTGSTMEACVRTLSKINGIKISIATIAYAQG